MIYIAINRIICFIIGKNRHARLCGIQYQTARKQTNDGKQPDSHEKTTCDSMWALHKHFFTRIGEKDWKVLVDGLEKLLHQRSPCVSWSSDSMNDFMEYNMQDTAWMYWTHMWNLPDVSPSRLQPLPVPLLWLAAHMHHSIPRLWIAVFFQGYSLGKNS